MNQQDQHCIIHVAFTLKVVRVNSSSGDIVEFVSSRVASEDTVFLVNRGNPADGSGRLPQLFDVDSHGRATWTGVSHGTIWERNL